MKEQLIENSDFKHTEQFKGVKRVETTQTVRGNAVDWARTKIGCEFEYLNSSGAPNNPGDDNKWYCSELIHVAYKNQGVTLGSEIPWPTPYNGYVPPSTPWPWAIWYDGDVTSVSSKSIGSVSSTDSNGNAKNCFLTTETVYAKGTGFCKNCNYNIYVCSHPVSNGASLSGSSSVSTDSNGYFTPQPKSLGPFPKGDYDIVVDENGDGYYNSGIDAIDSSVAVCECCTDDDCPEDQWCEEGECVPEASTLILFATGLLSLAGIHWIKEAKYEISVIPCPVLKTTPPSSERLHWFLL